jgi:hypothetical protein
MLEWPLGISIALSWALFSLPAGELNPQQISELNLEMVLAAFGASWPVAEAG